MGSRHLTRQKLISKYQACTDPKIGSDRVPCDKIIEDDCRTYVLDWPVLSVVLQIDSAALKMNFHKSRRLMNASPQ